ncbi:hypothetical protein [Streptomyces puniciscabiei]|uniref:hypothetical protein n=1 Tax=Streptomyces puniciscabiei TaxID=164348 RepID=UPI00332B02F9
MTSSGPGGVSGNTFNGPVALQVGNDNSLDIHLHSTAPAPLDAVADELARVVAEQWHEEAGLRRLLQPAALPVRWKLTERKLAGRVLAATAEGTHTRFTPLPGLPPVTRESLRAGGGLAELHQLYGGLASGRLLLVGPPAAGKTAAAVLLLLTALAHRAASPADRARIPVPVLLSLNGWDPTRQKAAEWAADRLSREYTLFADRGGRERALELVKAGRVALFLDGFDEVAGNKLRGAMTGALELAPCRVVLVSRLVETAVMPKKMRLGGAVALEIEPVRPQDAAEYLLNSNSLPDPPPLAWRALTDRLLHHPDSPVAGALARPLAITLLRDVYAAGDRVDELLDETRFPAPEDIENHLLDHAVTAAYTPRAGHPPPRWSPETAKRTLRYIARHLTGEVSRELRWWHLPGWTPSRPRALAMGAAVTVVCGVHSVFLVWLLSHSLYAALGGIPAALFGAWGVGCRFGDLSDPQPLQSAGWRDIFSLGAVVSGVVEWVITGTVMSLTAPLLDDRPPPGWLCFLTTLPMGFTGVLVTGRGHQIVVGVPFLSIGATSWYDPVRAFYNRPPVADTRSIGPRTRGGTTSDCDWSWGC